MCTRGDTAHIDTIFKFLPHTRQHVVCWRQFVWNKKYISDFDGESLVQTVFEGPKNRFEENILDGLNSQNGLLDIVTVSFSVKTQLMLIFG